MRTDWTSKPAGVMSRRGFTIIELSVVLVIIALLSGILLFAVRRAILSSRVTAERQFCNTLKIGCEQFKQQFGFLPPVVDDVMGPTESLGGDDGWQPKVRDAKAESRLAAPNFNVFWSDYTISYFLVGAGNKDLDGIDGPGFTFPRDDSRDKEEGHFAKKGKAYEPLFDVNKDRKRLVQLVDPTSAAYLTAPKPQIIDRWMKPYRYYRWEPTHYTKADGVDASRVGTVKSFNIPSLIELALGGADSVPELRQGGFAIFSAGPDGYFGDESADADENKRRAADNIVEIGR